MAAEQKIDPQAAISGGEAEEPKTGGFPAGTLVHTKEGRKPIEQLQVGDWVLSRHESGQGEREYKRVTRTFVHEDRELILFDYACHDAAGNRQGFRLVCTPEHPIWVKKKGWKEAGKLKIGDAWDVETLLGVESYVAWEPRRLFLTGMENIAWLPLSSASSAFNYNGRHINVNSLEIVNEDADLLFESIRKNKRVKPEHLFSTQVFNIEVEDFHCCYIGEAGLLVQDHSPVPPVVRKK